MAQPLVWILGRGGSAACGLKWVVPSDWPIEPRESHIDKIKTTLRAEMLKSSIDPYRKLLSELSSRTEWSRRHLFLTTNWDTILEEAIDELNLTELPSW